MCAVVACLLKWQSTTGTACAGFKGTLFENGGSNNVCRKPKHSLRLFSEYSCLFWVPGQKPYPWKISLTSIFIFSSNVRVLTHLPKPCTANVSERKLRRRKKAKSVLVRTLSLLFSGVVCNHSQRCIHTLLRSVYCSHSHLWAVCALHNDRGRAITSSFCGNVCLLDFSELDFLFELSWNNNWCDRTAGVFQRILVRRPGLIFGKQLWKLCIIAWGEHTIQVDMGTRKLLFFLCPHFFIPFGKKEKLLKDNVDLYGSA